MRVAQLFHTTRICEEAKSRKNPLVWQVEFRELFFSIDSIFFGIARNSLGFLFDNENTGQEQHIRFLRVSLSFHNASFLYTLKYFPPDNDVLKNARILNFHSQRGSLKSVQRLAEKFKP